MIDCRRCKHSEVAYHGLLCKAVQPVTSSSWRRDSRNECGIEAKLFEEKDKKQLERWIPF